MMTPRPNVVVCNNCACTKAGEECIDCTMHGCQCPCQSKVMPNRRIDFTVHSGPYIGQKWSIIRYWFKPLPGWLIVKLTDQNGHAAIREVRLQEIWR